MAERRKHITTKIDELNQAIESSEPIDGEIHAPLERALGDVKEAIEADYDPEVDHSVLTESLGDIALRLEVSHPELTDVLNTISRMLSGIGI